MTKRRVANWMEPFLRHKKAVILDGGMGTTLGEQGANIGSPFWSASMFFEKDSPVKPDLVYNIHRQFLEAGADVILANTYQLSQELIERIPNKSGEKREASVVIKKCINLACKARDDFQRTLSPKEPRRLVSASFGPYGSSIPFSGAEYTGNYDCTDEELVRFWERRLVVALETECDLIGCETIPDYRETTIIVDVLNRLQPDRPCYISFVCKDAEHVCGGPALSQYVKVVENCAYIDTIGVNCTPPQHILKIIQDLNRLSSKAILTYPNSGREWDAREEVRDWVGEKTDFAGLTNQWSDSGCVAVGGCCDCNASHVRSIRNSLLFKAKL